MHFHLAHIIPSKSLHGLNGYKEVIDTVQWGLQQLGHSATYGLNALSPTATNIVFGAQVLSTQSIEQLPPETIVYNFEQLRGASPGDIKPALVSAAKRLQIWDYSEANRSIWLALGAKNPCVVPVGYAPVLRRIQKPVSQDIDVLLYGLPANDRLFAFHNLSHAGLTTVFLCGLYGKARDDIIGRSKLVLNINAYRQSKIFEIVRVSYLLANQKAVIAETDADGVIDDDLRPAIRPVTSQQLVGECMRLLADEDARLKLEQAGFHAIEQRDIRKILQRVLSTQS